MPIGKIKYRKLYLTADHQLTFDPSKEKSTVSYDSNGNNPQQSFTLTFDHDTELTGYMKLHLYVEAEAADMELQVKVEKLDAGGKALGDPVTHMPIQSEGYLRVSQRSLDQSKSTDIEPVLAHDKEELLHKGEIVPVDIALWPMGMIYHKSEKLRLTIGAYTPPDASTVPPFGSAKITVPKKGYTYEPGKSVPMVTYGGLDQSNPGVDKVSAPPTRNKGKHIFHIGDQYDSYLQVPVVSE